MYPLYHATQQMSSTANTVSHLFSTKNKINKVFSEFRLTNPDFHAKIDLSLAVLNYTIEYGGK
jgi:hypothetical protein